VPFSWQRVEKASNFFFWVVELKDVDEKQCSITKREWHPQGTYNEESQVMRLDKMSVGAFSFIVDHKIGAPSTNRETLVVFGDLPGVGCGIRLLERTPGVILEQWHLKALLNKGSPYTGHAYHEYLE
jgi:hypothetical protein